MEWWLEISNEGTEAAQDCRANLEDITTVIKSDKLLYFPRNTQLHFSHHTENIERFGIIGGQSAMLGILYWGTDGFVPYQNGEPMVTLPFHAGINKADSRDFRRRYTLNIGESVLLLINVAYAGKQPIYIVIRINLQHLHGPQVREVDDSSLFEVLYIGDEKKDLTQFTEKSEGQYSEQQL